MLWRIWIQSLDGFLIPRCELFSFNPVAQHLVGHSSLNFLGMVTLINRLSVFESFPSSVGATHCHGLRNLLNAESHQRLLIPLSLPVRSVVVAVLVVSALGPSPKQLNSIQVRPVRCIQNKLDLVFEGSIFAGPSLVNLGTIKEDSHLAVWPKVLSHRL